MSLKNRILIMCLVVVLVLGAFGCTKKTEPKEEPKKTTEEESKTPTEEPTEKAEPSIMWGDAMYIIQDTETMTATKDQLKDKLGEVSKVVDMDTAPTANGEANMFTKGSAIYSLKDKAVEDEIAIEFDAKYYIAKKKM
ncbi:hypothetical protein PV797_09070 [Clostridiaceae bacterium M8S5]|nr:hypothetical protein PV797_09070 [Clostridiaceae bacterium M8S5]